MIAVRISEDLETRLDRLAKLTGRTKTFYVREAIEDHLEDLEDAYLAASVLENIRTGREKLISLEDVVKQYGLDD
jgi:RHH-type transcriptional regulator, rel operon repressor / antitoxin RelB